MISSEPIFFLDPQCACHPAKKIIPRYLKVMKQILQQLVQKQDLTTQRAGEVLSMLTNKEANPIQISAILTALKTKGETVDEMVGFINGMRNHMQTILSNNAIDVCGTGGDNSNTFNISTAVSFVVTGTGVKIAKHGNRAASSNCGSADVLEELGINIMLAPKQAEEVLQKVGMVFLFAPIFHVSFKQVVMVRKTLGIPTIFNYLGPFTNPAKVKRQLIGVPNKIIAKKLAQVAAKLDYERLCIVTSEDGLDELSLGSKNTVYQIEGKTIKHFTLNPQKLGFVKVAKSQLFGGDKQTNAQIILSVLQGEKSPYRDVVVLNAAMALYVAGKAENIKKGIKQAEKSIDSGKAVTALQNLQKETQTYA